MLNLISLAPSLLKGLFRNIEFIIIAALVLGIFFKSTQVSSLKAAVAKEKADVALLKQANQINLDTISTLQEWQDRQTQVFGMLEVAVNDVKTSTNDLRLEMAELGRTDEQSRNYLETPIPNAIRRVLIKPPENGSND